ncbi:MAG TPA: cyanophycinase [Steroidobacteraceae bacterium]|nr:cyanophycinase [Steroidobacteraceae bacterium]
MTRIVAVLALLVATLPPLVADAAKSPNPAKVYFRIGNANDAIAPATPGTVLMGGGTDVDTAFQWLCAKAPGGDFLVIRATGTDAYNPYVQELCPGLNSVATLIIGSASEASSDFVREKIAQAEVLWLAGGDQSNYINDWTGTAVQQELNLHVERGQPVGGTSAGLAVLTQFVYSALGSQGVTTTQALADPYHKWVTLARDFASIPALADTIGDTHFVTRDRMGRTLAFLCRIHANGWSAAPRGIAIDEETALLIDGAGKGTVVGNSNVYFIAAPGAPEICQPRTPLTYRNVAVRKLGAGGAFDVAAWRGNQGITYSVSAEAGVLSSTQPGGSAY